jgi:hypothetical protein
MATPAEVARAVKVARALHDLEEAILGGPAGKSASTSVPPPRPRVMVNRGTDEVLSAVPPVDPSGSASALLAQFGKYGFRERSFDVVVPVTAPQPITNEGSWYDAGKVYDGWILNPSVDTAIDFDKAPNQNTPFISANSRMQFAVRKSRVYYLSVNPGITGTMQVWLLAYSG